MLSCQPLQFSSHFFPQLCLMGYKLFLSCTSMTCVCAFILYSGWLWEKLCRAKRLRHKVHVDVKWCEEVYVYVFISDSSHVQPFPHSTRELPRTWNFSKVAQGFFWFFMFRRGSGLWEISFFQAGWEFSKMPTFLKRGWPKPWIFHFSGG